MKDLDFSHDINQLRERVGVLKGISNDDPAQLRAVLQDTTSDLLAVLEKMQNFEGELTAIQQAAEMGYQGHLAAISIAPGGYLVTDTEGTIQDADRAVANLFHIAQHRFIGKPLASFVSPEESEDFLIQLARSSKVDHIQEWETKFRLRNGHDLLAAITMAPIRNLQSGLVGLRWLIRDIGQQKEAQLAMQKAYDELKQRIKERTTEVLIINEQLTREILSRKQAEEALRKAHDQLEKRVLERTAELAIANERLQAELVERKRADSIAAKRALELSALHSATTALLSTLEIDGLLSQILDAAISAIPEAEKGTLHLIAHETGRLEIRATIGFTDPRIQKFAFPGSKGFVAKAVQERMPLLILDLQNDPTFRYNGTIPEVRAIQSAIVAPLILDDQVLGVLSLNSSRRSAFDEEGLQLLVSFAATATAAIRNAQLHSEVKLLALSDTLTGIYNRRGFLELGRREIERTRRFRHPLSAIWIDIDYFKNINDTYGHSAGDQVLRAVAQRIKKNIRDVDILGRYGGDEFTILLPETDLFTASSVAERLRNCISDLSVLTEDGRITITASLGAAKVTAETAGLEALLNRADSAMYNAKQSGRNRVEVR